MELPFQPRRIVERNPYGTGMVRRVIVDIDTIVDESADPSAAIGKAARNMPPILPVTGMTIEKVPRGQDLRAGYL